MKRIVSGTMLTLLLIGMLTLAFDIRQSECSVPPPTEWNRTYGGASDDMAWSVVQTSDGGYAVAGYTSSFGAGGVDFWLVKVDSSGDMQWNLTHGTGLGDYAYSVVQTSDGGYAVAGIATGWDFRLIKIDSLGNMEWSKTYEMGTWYEPCSVVQTSDGGYAVAGSCPGNVRLTKADSTGNMQWNKTYHRRDYNFARSIVQTSDEGYVLAGSTGDYSFELDFWLVKTDSFGNVEWDQVYGGPWYDDAYSVVQTSDGGYAVAGYTESFGDDDFWLVKTDSSGNVEWDQTYGGFGVEWAYSVVQTRDGGYVVAGEQYHGAGIRDVFLVRTNSTGQVCWTGLCGGVDTDDAGRSVQQTSDGGYAVAGYTNSFGAGGNDFWLIKLAPDGVHDLAITDVTPEKRVVMEGDILSINVTVENQGGLAETFTVTAYNDSMPIETKTVANLSSGEDTTIIFTWNTTGVEKGDYIISAKASVVPCEVETTDNTMDAAVTVVSPGHDVAIKGLSPSKTVVGQGYSLNVNVVAKNYGSFTETFNVSVFYEETVITLPDGKNYTTTTLTSGNSTTLTFTWNTTGVAKGNYTIKAKAIPLPEETDTADNTFIDGWVIVSMVGDITGPDGWPDGKCDIRDLAMVAILYGVIYPDPRYDPNCDINNDLKIDIKDLATVAVHYGEIDP